VGLIRIVQYHLDLGVPVVGFGSAITALTDIDNSARHGCPLMYIWS